MVTASTLTDPYAVVASAVGTLAGPLHGGANEEVIAMLQEIGSVENVRPYVEKCIETKSKIMGFGHRVYKVKDPRATILQKLAEQLFEKFGQDEYYEIALEMEQVISEKLGHKGVYPNVDFYSGLVYRKLGIPVDLFTPVFAIARVAGWLAHWKRATGRKPYLSTYHRFTRVPAARITSGLKIVPKFGIKQGFQVLFTLLMGHTPPGHIGQTA